MVPFIYLVLGLVGSCPQQEALRSKLNEPQPSRPRTAASAQSNQLLESSSTSILSFLVAAKAQPCARGDNILLDPLLDAKVWPGRENGTGLRVLEEMGDS